MLTKRFSKLFTISLLIIGSRLYQSPLSFMDVNNNQDTISFKHIEKTLFSEISTQKSSKLPIILEPLLPKLNNDDLDVLKNSLNDGIQSWFDLVRLNKLNQPPILSEELKLYRQKWTKINSESTPFLGLWHDDQSLENRYYLGIFPSSSSKQLCILEFKPEWSLLISNEETGKQTKDVISEEILSFSVAKVESGQIKSSRIRSTKNAIARKKSPLSETIEFLAVMDKQDNIRMLAALSPPTLPPNLPQRLIPEVNQALSQQGCKAIAKK